MTSPDRPAVLIIALVLLPLAALLFAMTATALDPTATTTGLPSLTLLTALLAIRFNWARWTTLVLLLLQILEWFPGALEYVTDGDATQQRAATYALIATALAVTGAALMIHPRTITYYEQAAIWRHHRRNPTQ